MQNVTAELETQTPVPAVPPASVRMAGKRRSALILLATIVLLLGIASITICWFPWFFGLVGLLVLAAFVWSGHTAWLFLFCLAVVCAQTLAGFDKFAVQPLNNLNLHEISQVVCVFLILVAGFRYADLKKYVLAFDGDAMGQTKTPRSKGFQWSTFRVTVRRQWLLSVVALCAAVCLLLYLPADDSYLYDYWLQPKPGRMIIISLLLFFAWFVCRAAVSVLDWTALTPQKADIAFRSWYNREMWREMAGVERRRQKFRQDNNSD